MKYLAFMLLTSCFYQCPPKQYSNFLYGTHVLVIDGFFKGQTGIIMAQVQIYQASSCNLEGFRVKLDTSDHIIEIDQRLLIKGD